MHSDPGFSPPAYDEWDNKAADDFVVPFGETWSIERVDVLGAYYAGPGPAASFNVYFYNNASGFPGTLVAGRMAQPDTNDASPRIALGDPVILTAGTYWVSVQASLDHSTGGQWGWRDRTIISNNPAAWRNPGAGWGDGCTSWTKKTDCVDTPDPDLAFRLNGTGGGTPGDTFTNHEFAVIPDGVYDGSLVSMTCTNIDASSLPAAAPVTSVSITTNIGHTWVGDLTAKLVSPDGSVLGVFSRPGLTELADDGSGCCGDSSLMDGASQITFKDGSTNDAELMGAALSGGEAVCTTDGMCDFAPNPGSVAAPPSTFAGFAGETASGIWTLCVGDSRVGDAGGLVGWSIAIIHGTSDALFCSGFEAGEDGSCGGGNRTPDQ